MLENWNQTIRYGHPLHAPPLPVSHEHLVSDHSWKGNVGLVSTSKANPNLQPQFIRLAASLLLPKQALVSEIASCQALSSWVVIKKMASRDQCWQIPETIFSGLLALSTDNHWRKLIGYGWLKSTQFWEKRPSFYKVSRLEPIFSGIRLWLICSVTRQQKCIYSTSSTWYKADTGVHWCHKSPRPPSSPSFLI